MRWPEDSTSGTLVKTLRSTSELNSSVHDVINLDSSIDGELLEQVRNTSILSRSSWRLADTSDR